MVKYYYDKYTAVSSTTYVEPAFDTEKPVAGGVIFQGKATSYLYDNKINKFSTSGSFNNSQVKPGDIFYDYRESFGLLYRYKATGNGSYTDYVSATVAGKYEKDATQKTDYTKGSLLQSNIIAEDGTYPNNGKYTDGYWYVRGTVVNTAPTTPGAFTSPTSGLTGGKNSTVSWGVSTDAEGNAITYELDASFDNGSTYSNVYSGSAVSFTYAVPTNQKQVKFRVRAKDTANAYSGYTYSNNLLINQPPTVTINTADNTTLYENSTYTIAGNVKDADDGDIVNAKYSINDGSARALATGISDGSTAIVFNKPLTFKNGKLFDRDVAVTDALAEGTAHTLKVWATDDKGATSTIITRTFFAVPNRAPSLTINTPQPSGTINSDKFTISGTCSDIDGNDVVVTYRINSGLSTEIYRGAGADFAFDVSLGELNVGNNAIVVEVADTYGFKTSKTVKLNKSEIDAPLLSSTARYQVLPPKGSAKGIVLWVQHQTELNVEASISAVLAGEQERFVAMTKTNTAPVDANTVEDEFTFESSDAKEDITIKLDLTRESADVSDAITLITGVLS